MPNETQSQTHDPLQSLKRSQMASSQASTDQGEASPEGQTGRTYTQAEVDKIQSKKDTELANERALRKAAENRLRVLEDTNESLKDQVVSLKSEIEKGVPEDSKEYRNQLVAREEKLKEDQRNWKREHASMIANFAEREERDRKELARSLADNYGVDIDALLGIEDSEKMKAYALDHIDVAKIVSKAQGQSTTTANPNPPVIPATNTGSIKSIADKTPEQKIMSGLAKLQGKT